VFDDAVEETLKTVCNEIEKRYEIRFLEIGTDRDHVHFLIQSVPMYSPKKIIQIIKSITAKEIFQKHPEVKKKLWGGEFWTDGYFVNTVSQFGNEDTITNYIKNQGGENKYKQLHRSAVVKQEQAEQISLFD